MTRRDTIIIAVFINAAILVALFISALRSNRDATKEFSMATVEKPKEEEMPLAKTEVKLDSKPFEGIKPEIKSAEGDEVDLVLKQFAQNASQLAQMPQQTETPPVSSPTIDFAQDLQALMVQQPAPPVVAPVEPASSKSLTEVVVRKGDALEKIARAHQTTVREIMRLNGLKNPNLRIGQVLKVASGADRKKGATNNVSPASVKYYTVKNGDNPWTIAVKNQLKVEELLRLNNMDEQKARHLKPGDKLRIQ